MLTPLLCLFVARAGAKLPALDAIDTAGKSFRLEDDLGLTIVLVLSARPKRSEIERVTQAVVGLVKPGQVDVLNVVDFTAIPAGFRGYAKREIAESARKSPIRFLIDERGAWKRAFQGRSEDHIDLVVFDRQGDIRGRFPGEAEFQPMLRLVEGLNKAQSRPSP